MRPAVLLLAFLAVPEVGLSATLHVPSEYSTIQEAINAAYVDDNVLVAAGTYFENIDFVGKNITVKSVEGTGKTFIDGLCIGSVVTFSKGEGPSAKLEGFTITNGSGTDVPGWGTSGGGIVICYESSPTIRHNIITKNYADYGSGIEIYIDSYPAILNNIILNNEAIIAGGGICCSHGSGPKISENIISGNSSEEWAGGIGCYYSATPIIENNYILENWARLYGAGIDCFEFINPPGTITIQNNVIVGNWTDIVPTSDGGAAGIACSSYNALIAGNVIANNSSNYGGGITCNMGSIATLINNTISGNYAGVNGGGILCFEASMVIVNTIVAFNESPLGAEMAIGGVIQSVVDMSYSNVLDGQTNVFVDPGHILNWGPGMIDSDPCFVNESSGDCHLYYYSLCRDAGDDSVSGIPALDFEGDPRVVAGAVDIGADEFYTHLYCTGDFIPGGYIEGKIVGFPGISPVGLFLGSGVLDPPLHHMWGDFYLDAPWFLLSLWPIPSEGVLVIPATLPVTPPAPYDIPMQALIGDKFTNLFVLEVR